MYQLLNGHVLLCVLSGFILGLAHLVLNAFLGGVAFQLSTGII